MNINNESQNLKKLMKKIFASRNVNFACQGLISSKNDAILVRNVLLIFIHHMIPIYEVIIKLTQVTIYIQLHRIRHGTAVSKITVSTVRQ